HGRRDDDVTAPPCPRTPSSRDRKGVEAPPLPYGRGSVRTMPGEVVMSAKSASRTGGDLLVQRLYEYGVRQVFGYPGGPLTPLYDALYREPRVRHILARHEQGAGFMADGAARATGQTGVCITVCGPGAFNAATPIAGAFSDSVPVLLINGQVPSREPRSGYYHENDQ